MQERKGRGQTDCIQLHAHYDSSSDLKWATPVRGAQTLQPAVSNSGARRISVSACSLWLRLYELITAHIYDSDSIHSIHNGDIIFLSATALPNLIPTHSIHFSLGKFSTDDATGSCLLHFSDRVR